MAKAFSNRFLETLRSRYSIDLASQCEHLPMPLGTMIFEHGRPSRYAHFLTSGVASIVNTMASGSAVEIGMFGFEGFPESSQLLGPKIGERRSMMQVGGSALRMDFDRLREIFHENEAVRELALRLIQFEHLSLSQVAACNGLHEVEERLARWLLMVQDRIGEPELPLTQEFLSDMLGTRRSTVTLAAGNLQRAGMIEYRRGIIRVLQRDRLHDVACECYDVLEAARQSLYHDA